MFRFADGHLQCFLSSDSHPIVCLADGHVQAVVARPRDCTVCRECIRPAEWQDHVKIERINDHYICELCVSKER